MLNCGVYTIENTTNGKLYVGSSVNLYAREVSHKHALRKDIHHSVILQRAWNKYGENNFIFKTILFCSRDDAVYYEQLFLDVLKPFYNICTQAKSILGIKLGHPTKEHRQKISKSKMGRVGVTKGVSLSETHKKAVSLAKTGKPRSESTKKSISRGMKIYRTSLRKV